MTNNINNTNSIYSSVSVACLVLGSSQECVLHRNSPSHLSFLLVSVTHWSENIWKVIYLALSAGLRCGNSLLCGILERLGCHVQAALVISDLAVLFARWHKLFLSYWGQNMNASKALEYFTGSDSGPSLVSNFLTNIRSLINTLKFDH